MDTSAAKAADKRLLIAGGLTLLLLFSTVHLIPMLFLMFVEPTSKFSKAPEGADTSTAIIRAEHLASETSGVARILPDGNYGFVRNQWVDQGSSIERPATNTASAVEPATTVGGLGGKATGSTWLNSLAFLLFPNG